MSTGAELDYAGDAGVRALVPLLVLLALAGYVWANLAAFGVVAVP